MPLAPNPGGGNGQYARHADAHEEVTRQDRNLGEGDLEDERERQGIGGQDGTQRGREDRGQAEEAEDQIALPQGPILRCSCERPALAIGDGM